MEKEKCYVCDSSIHFDGKKVPCVSCREKFKEIRNSGQYSFELVSMGNTTRAFRVVKNFGDWHSKEMICHVIDSGIFPPFSFNAKTENEGVARFYID